MKDQENTIPNLNPNKPAAANNTNKSSAAQQAKGSASNSTSNVVTHASAVATQGMDAGVMEGANEIQSLRAINDSLSLTLANSKQEMEGLEKERDFYFDKLRNIEVLLQVTYYELL